MASLRRSLSILALLASCIPAGALRAQTKDDTLSVLREVERALHVRLAKPGAEGHYLIIGVAPSLSDMGALVADTFGRLCVEGSRLTPELGIASIVLTRFVVQADTAVVEIRTTDGGGASGTLDHWRLKRDAGGRWEGAVASGSPWEGEPVMGRPQSLSYCKGREPG